MLMIWLELCRRAGIEEIVINLHAHADLVQAAIREYKGNLKVRIMEEVKLLGSAGTLLRNRDWVAAERTFWVFYADVLTNMDLQQMLVWHESSDCAATLGLYQVDDPSRCGIVRFDEKKVIREFEEKPQRPKSNWAFSGVLIGTPELLHAIPQKTPVDLGFSVLPKLVGRMLAYPIRDYLLDIGTIETYQAAQETWPGFPAEAKD